PHQHLPEPKDTIQMNAAFGIARLAGASRGIGLETVRRLAEAGVHTLLAGRDRARAVEAALKLQAQGLPVEAIALDVTDAASIDAAAQEVERRHGRLDILVNNAGILADDPARPVSGQSLDAWRKTFDTNVFGLIAVTQALLPLLRRSDAGRIVNVSSALGSIGLHADPASFIYDMKIPAYVGPPGGCEVPGGARTSVRRARVDEAGPNGGFFYLGESLPWWAGSRSPPWRSRCLRHARSAPTTCGRTWPCPSDSAAAPR